MRSEKTPSASIDSIDQETKSFQGRERQGGSERRVRLSLNVEIDEIDR
jgi:hypothetical protein